MNVLNQKKVSKYYMHQLIDKINKFIGNRHRLDWSTSFSFYNYYVELLRSKFHTVDVIVKNSSEDDYVAIFSFDVPTQRLEIELDDYRYTREYNDYLVETLLEGWQKHYKDTTLDITYS